uniref:HAT C-terminal dimerisation domain-containing protein n=1 Tax=Fusarium oxysporum (strain Fo5176) TaxID=660025 RepID=A0A0C4DIN7_FUSOF
MDSKEAVLEACRQIEEMDQASFNIDMMQGWKKRKERGWSQLGPLGKLHNTAIHIRANDYRYNLFRRRAGKVLGLDNDTRWNSWFLLLDAALDKEEHIKWYQDKYYDALVDDYLAPQDWQNLRETRNFLQPFWKITLLTEGYRSTLDRTLFTMDVLHKHYQQAFSKYRMNQQLLGPVLTSWHVFDKYYQLSDESPAYAAALILHPSRGKAHIQKNWPKAWHKKIFTGVKKLWEDEYKNLPTVYTTPSIVPALELDEHRA